MASNNISNDTSNDTHVKFIKNDIALTKFDSINYPSIAGMTTLKKQLEIIPSSLKLFLNLFRDQRNVFLHEVKE